MIANQFAMINLELKILWNCFGWKQNVRPDERGRDGRRSFDRGNGGDRNHRRDDDRRGNDYGDDGHYGPPSRGGRRHSRSDDDDYNDDGDGDRRPRKKTRDSDGAPKKREYPPRFEASGASFIFDARSGMFYEPASDFFYDPKTKLYYGNKKRQYFRYDAEKKEGGHKFVPIGEDGNGNGGNGQGGGGVSSRVVTAAEEAAAEAAPPDTETRPEKVETKPKIAISLKTAIPHKDSSAKTFDQVRAMEKTKLEIKTIKRKKSSLSAAAETNDAAPPQSHKKHAKNMDKWSERVKEMKDENADDTRQPASEKVKTTASGQPICILCRRKFANAEKLAQHEKLSALHKENAAKKLAADAAKEAEKKRKADANYRDRSKERRQMYGANHVVPESSHAEAILAHSLGNPTEPKAAETIRPEETLNNDANVGNKLLQKLGWKSGGGLGRNAGKDAPPGSSNGDVASNLKSDWERIESLAQRGGGRR